MAPGTAIVATFGLAFAGSGAAMYLWARGLDAATRSPPLSSSWRRLIISPISTAAARLPRCCAIAFIPLLALGLKRVAEGKGPALAALAYAAMIATHLPLALLASLFLVAPYALVLAKGRPRALLAFAPPLALGIALSAIYLLPALMLERYRDAAVLWSHEVLRPDHWLLAANWVEPLDGMRLITLKVIAVITLPALFMAWRWRSLWAGWAILCCLVVAGLLPFFWDLPLVQSVQFPFRALPFAEFGLATAIALAPKGERVAALLVLPALALSATFLLAPAPDGAPVAPAELATPSRRARESAAGAAALWLAVALGARSRRLRHRAPVRPGRGDDRAGLLFPGLAGRLRRRGRAGPSPISATGLLAHRGTGCTRRSAWTGPELAGAARSASPPCSCSSP